MSAQVALEVAELYALYEKVGMTAAPAFSVWSERLVTSARVRG